MRSGADLVRGLVKRRKARPINLLRYAALSALVGPMLAPSEAGAVTFLTSGDQYTIGFDGRIGGTTVAGLASSLTLRLAQVGGGVFTFDYWLSNTSSIDSRTSSFGFSSYPDITGGQVIYGAFKNLTVGNYPGYKDIDLCLTGGTTCGGGANGGALDGGPTLTGRFNLYASGDRLVLDDFGVRYQSINGTVNGTRYYDESGIGLGVVEPVPEPSTWVMFIVGFGIIGNALRQERRRLVGTTVPA